MINMNILRNKVAIITGAGRGIGKSIALKFAAEDCNIGLVDINVKLLQEIKNNLKSDIKVKLYNKNVLNKDDIEEVFQSAVNEFGTVDILVNNVGGSANTPSEFEKVTEGDFEKVINLNLKSCFICTQIAYKYMKKRRYGRIVNVASLAGRSRSFLAGSQYAASKGGVIALTRHLSGELGKHGITINSVAPGVIYGSERIREMWKNENNNRKKKLIEDIPLKRLGEMEEVANCVLFLASDSSSYINGATLDVNGGLFVG